MLIELISTFRKKISFHSTLLLILVAVLLLVLFIIRFNKNFDNEFLEGVTMMSFIMLIFMASFILDRRKSRIKALKAGNGQQVVSSLEATISKEQGLFKSTYILRFIMGIVFALGMLLLLFFKPGSWFTGTVFAGFIGFILLSMLKGWMLMMDSMMLQDIKHAVNDQTSDIS